MLNSHGINGGGFNTYPIKRKNEDKEEDDPRRIRSRLSARDCRERKKLRYENLEQFVKDREIAVLTLREELYQLRQVCIEFDKNHLSDEMSRQLQDWSASSTPADDIESCLERNLPGPSAFAQNDLYSYN
ncbi:hypothetical protein GJ496_009236 [Pomphorhynchus laevis]|nr:hypothetical protein GJ496_009236 [Pomphorhynchus laevis]